MSSAKNLLAVFFATHDPTTLNRQRADRGTHYRSIILYANENQKDQAEAFVTELDRSGSRGRPIVTELAPLEKFYEAEAEHKDYYMEYLGSMYCQIVISPKIEKVRKEFGEHLP